MKKAHYYFSVFFRIVTNISYVLAIYAVFRMPFILIIALKWENLLCGLGDLIAYLLGFTLGALMYVFIETLKPYVKNLKN